MEAVYSEKAFIKLILNKKQADKTTNPQEVIDAYEEIFELMERLPGTFCFIYDFFNFKYILFSKSIRSVTGISEEVLMKGGFQKALDYFHPVDRGLIGLIHKELFDYMYSQPEGDIIKLRFDFNYRLINSSGKYIQFLQQSAITTVLDGKPLYDFSTCTDVTKQKTNSRMELNIYKLDKNNVYKLVYEYIAPGSIGFGVSATEFKILKMASEGLSSKEIAEKCFRSIHTINNHRRNILSKTNSTTLAEAILKVEF